MNAADLHSYIVSFHIRLMSEMLVRRTPRRLYCLLATVADRL